VPDPDPGWQWNGAAGWQVDLDGGAEAGAHAIAQRLGVAHGAIGGALALSLGPPLRKNASGVAVDLSRSSVLGEAELRWRDFRFGLGAGVAIYHRATVDVPGGLMATDSQVQAALDVAPEVRWIGRLRGASWGIEITAGVDVVFGAPKLVVDDGGTSQTTIAKLATFQPRFGLGLVVGR
jgi:hypothetical protein